MVQSLDASFGGATNELFFSFSLGKINHDILAFQICPPLVSIAAHSLFAAQTCRRIISMYYVHSRILSSLPTYHPALALCASCHSADTLLCTVRCRSSGRRDIAHRQICRCLRRRPAQLNTSRNQYGTGIRAHPFFRHPSPRNRDDPGRKLTQKETPPQLKKY